jgi:hypothetical protein
MREATSCKINLDRMLIELLPKNIKVTQEAVNMIKNLCQELIQKISYDSGLSHSISSKNLLTQEDVLKIVAKSGLSKYIIELDEEIRRYTNEILEIERLSK